MDGTSSSQIEGSGADSTVPEDRGDGERTGAAFFDVDGTLIETNVVHAYVYYAVNAPTLTGKLKNVGSLLAKLPWFWLSDKIDRRTFNESFYAHYEGYTRDRLVVLGEEILEHVIKPNLYGGGEDLVRRAKDRGRPCILVTGALDVITAPLADYLGVDDYVANRLRFKDGVATGELEEPMMAGANKALWIRRYAERNGYDLDDSYAYADSGSDVPMLSVVGHPCAVNPDASLRRKAKSYDWPVLNFETA